jgi:histidinol-phosphate aminotransferase
VAERELRRKLVLHFGAGLTEQHFLVGNGATDILRMIAQGFILENSEAISCRISFPMYASLTIMFGGIPVSVDPLPNYGYDLDATCEAVTERTSVIWLCSPNNPTGLILSKEALDGLLRRIPEHVLVVIDESYCDFICEPYRPNSLEYVTSGANVILVRSFSKIYGLANLRVGYGIARPELVDYLGYCVLPFNSGAPALQAAAASLDDTEFLKRSCELIRQEREYVSTELKRMGLRCLPSQANFILVIDPPVEVHTIVDSLLRQGIAVRPMAGFGLPNAFRVTLGLHEQNQCFLEALQTILQ